MSIPDLPSFGLGKKDKDHFLNILLDGRDVDAVLEKMGAHLVENTDVLGYASSVSKDMEGFIDLKIPSSISRRSGLVAQSFLSGGIEEALGVSSKNIRELVGAIRVGAVEPGALAVALDSTIARARTTMNTALAGLQRQVAENVSNEMLPSDEDLFLYSGPEGDRIIRPYCSVLVRKAVTIKGLRSTTNSQSLDPAIYLGGWNCRHSLTPILKEIAASRRIVIATAQDYAKASVASMSRRR